MAKRIKMLLNNSDKMIVSVNGKKLEVPSTDQSIDKISSHLPPDVAALLANIQNAGEVDTIKAEAEQKAKERLKVTQTSPSLNLRDLVDSLVNKDQAMVRSVPEVVQRAQEQQKALEEIRSDSSKKLTIYESGVALGMVLNNSDKQTVVNIMKEHSRVSFEPNSSDLIFFYSDISLTVFFNDNNVVSELQFGDFYKGSTARGLKIGDHIEKAIEIYGAPRMKTPKGAIWKNFGVFCNNDHVCTIRLQK
jgi:vacuolar-type H+-ATPase subunit E/Vma4